MKRPPPPQAPPPSPLPTPFPAKHTSGPHDAGHDEDDEKAKIGTPLERVLLMADAMLDAIKTFKSPDGKALCIRIGIPTPSLLPRYLFPCVCMTLCTTATQVL